MPLVGDRDWLETTDSIRMFGIFRCPFPWHPAWHLTRGTEVPSAVPCVFCLSPWHHFDSAILERVNQEPEEQWNTFQPTSLTFWRLRQDARHDVGARRV